MLVSERLILRQVELKDAPSIFKSYSQDARVAKYLTWAPDRTVDDTTLALRYLARKPYQWVIVLKSNPDEVIGMVTVISIEESTGSVGISYCLSYDYWHQGYMQEAIKRVLVYFFETSGYRRVWSSHDIRNQAAAKVMKACGFHYEGTLRQAAMNNQGICDCAFYSMIRSDYFTPLKKL